MDASDDRLLAPTEPVPGGVRDAGTDPSAEHVAALARGGEPVLVTLSGGGPELLAAASVHAWLGARVFRADAAEHAALRDVLDMVASIGGHRPPLLGRRGLA
ncbi:hypothetical protein [Actinomadura flavalba]|uniref:hypothetical protein n=1 Tax=Actinomadura flavalba TaxID=1120938 RepID=UPI000365932D|nr:hypothetical protein [Actinomadura flavalba]